MTVGTGSESECLSGDSELFSTVNLLGWKSEWIGVLNWRVGVRTGQDRVTYPNQSSVDRVMRL